MLFEHNKEVFKIMEQQLNEKGKSILILGTCLGKTSTALEYVKKYNLKALVLCPNLTIIDNWNGYENIDAITYQTFSLNYLNLNLKNYGIVICDEVHHAGAEEWGKGVKYILDNKITKVLGLTATALRGDGIDIADELFKDSVAMGMTVLEGIQNGILNGIKYINAYYNLEELKEKENELDNEILRKNLNLAINNTPTVKEILQKHMPKGKRKGIIFVSGKEDIELGKNILLNAFPSTKIKVLHSSETNNDKIREWFKNCTEGFIVSQNMINEGAHYNGVNTIIMLRRTGSSLLYYQQLGRVLTLSVNGDSKAIVFDLVNNNKTLSLLNNLREEESFKKEFLKQLNFSKEEAKAFEDSLPNQIIVADYTSQLDNILEEIRLSELKFKPWSDEEIKVIKNHYNDGKEILLSLIPERDWERICAKALELGIKIKTQSPRDFQWTSEEDEIIKKYYPKVGYKLTDKLPGRNEKSIMQRASKLEVKIDSFWTSEEEKLLIEIYPIYGLTESSKILKRSKGSVKGKASKLNLKSPEVWSEEEKKIIRECYPNEGTNILSRLQNKTKAQLIDFCSRHNIKFNPTTKRVLCKETGIIYKNASSAAKAVGKSISFIQQCCNSGKKCGGYHWEYV